MKLRYHKRLKLALSNQGVPVIGEFSCRGYDCKGPYIIICGGNKGKPNEEDLIRATKFIDCLLPKYTKNMDSTENENNVEIRYCGCIECGKLY